MVCTILNGRFSQLQLSTGDFGVEKIHWLIQSGSPHVGGGLGSFRGDSQDVEKNPFQGLGSVSSPIFLSSKSLKTCDLATKS